MNICQSVRDLIESLIAYPHLLKIEESTNAVGERSIIIQVAPDDIKKIIGNGGRNFRSIRTLIRSSLRDYNADMTVDIIANDR